MYLIDLVYRMNGVQIFYRIVFKVVVVVLWSVLIYIIIVSSLMSMK